MTSSDIVVNDFNEYNELTMDDYAFMPSISIGLLSYDPDSLDSLGYDIFDKEYIQKLKEGGGLDPNNVPWNIRKLNKFI